ncbi:MAG: hypothetical protein AB8G22_24750 [Saprospiraceae bacterium]
MIAKFEVETVFYITNIGHIVATKLLNTDADFSLTDNSKLGGIEIENWMDIPRAIDSSGKQRLDLFVFKLKHSEDKDKLQKGDLVLLTNA